MNFRILKNSSGIFAATVIALAIMAAPQYSQATTFANTNVTNNVTAKYKSLGGIDYTATGSITITVNLVKSMPTLELLAQTSPAGTAVDTANATNESTVVTQTYRLTANSNGTVKYNLSQISFTPDSNINVASLITVTTTTDYWLGSTAVGVVNPAVQSYVYVPIDTCTVPACGYAATATTIGGADGLGVADTVYISGTAYKISAIDNTATSRTDLDLDLRLKFAKITLTNLSAADVSIAPAAGIQIVEYKDNISVVMTTGTLIDPSVSATGVYAGSVTATDATNTTAAVTSSVYVATCKLSVVKVAGSTATGPWTLTSTNPTVDIFYKVTVTNTAGLKACNNVAITDVLSPYTAYKVGAPTFTMTGAASLGAATVTYYDQTQTSASIIAGTATQMTPSGTYDQTVSAFKATFPAANAIAASESFYFIYAVKVY